DFRSNFRTATDLRGNISIAKTSLRDRFFLEEFQSPVRYDSTGLEFSQITANAGDGEITGHFEIQPQTKDSPFTVSIRFRDVQAEIKYHINTGVVTLDQLIFRSQNIRLSATGTVSFDGKLHLESQLAVNEKMRSQLFQAIRSNFQPTDDPAYSAVSFQVSGTVGRPKTNLMDKLIGRDLKDLSSVISSFMGGSKSEKAKKKKEAEESAAAPAGSPTPTASP